MFSIKPVKTRQWWVVFEPCLNPAWYHRLMPRQFQHCYLMSKSPGGQFWIIMDASYEDIDVQLRLVDTFPTPEAYAGPHAVVVPYTSHITVGHRSAQLGIMSCVDLIKRCLGIRSYMVWTPYQLFRRLTNG